ncbi:MAG: type II toxin-antitoxin system RelE/ParE family toxin [Deltaproteobacteria bacterium]|nr:type II toxin-antitoxin system RelE/ParE family toxin [Deltaproteobacteria bacterium]
MKFILKTRRFSRWMKKTLLHDATLLVAIEEMERGLIDAELGGYILKKRIALPGRGKSGSVRTLIATKKEDRWIFMIGFEKNEKENITSAELAAIQALARDYLEFSDQMLLAVITSGQLEEVNHE